MHKVGISMNKLAGDGDVIPWCRHGILADCVTSQQSMRKSILAKMIVYLYIFNLNRNWCTGFKLFRKSTQDQSYTYEVKKKINFILTGLRCIKHASSQWPSEITYSLTRNNSPVWPICHSTSACRIWATWRGMALSRRRLEWRPVACQNPEPRDRLVLLSGRDDCHDCHFCVQRVSLQEELPSPSTGQRKIKQGQDIKITIWLKSTSFHLK